MDKTIIGCDPEIMFSKRGQRVDAHTIIRYNPKTAGFGVDGYTVVGEIRPGYSHNIITLVAKIEKILQEAHKKFDLKRSIDAILAGHFKCGVSIGGHIHFKSPRIKCHDNRQCDTTKLLGLKLDILLEDCLEELIAPKVERLRRLEHPRFGKKTTQSNDAIRIKEPDRFEYRPPGSWVISPEVALSYLWVAKATSLLVLRDKMPEWMAALTPPKTELGRIKKLERLALEASRVTVDEDIELGAQVTMDVISRRAELNWDVDIRKNWNI